MVFSRVPSISGALGAAITGLILVAGCSATTLPSAPSSDVPTPTGAELSHASVAFTPSIDCGEVGSCQLMMDIQAPTGEGPWPLILLVPGGPQPIPDEAALLSETLAPPLARQGAVVMTIQWRQGPRYGASFPAEVADLACAIGVARAIGASYGADPSKVTLVGHSLGGWAGAVLTLTPSEITPAEGTCTTTVGPLRPDSFVSVAGAFNALTLQDDIAMSDALGIDDDRFAAADPFTLLETYPAVELALPMTLIHGAEDVDVPIDVSRTFLEAAQARGYAVDLIEVAGAEHHTVLTAPETVSTIMSVAIAD